jgi:SAM-dependent methyltransferase
MNGFSKEWESVYNEGLQMTSWPWSDVVSLINRFCKNVIHNGKVLELGCGAGPNIPFLVSLGMEYYGIEGSCNVVHSLHDKFPKLKDKVIVGDFTNVDFFPVSDKVDIILDRAAVTHNDLNSINNTIGYSLNSLKSGGFFIGVDWFSTKHFDYKLGREGLDKNTRTDIEKGQFKNVGNVHFSDEGHLRNIFKNFDIVYLEEKVVKNYQNLNNHQFASWNIVARKR